MKKGGEGVREGDDGHRGRRCFPMDKGVDQKHSCVQWTTLRLVTGFYSSFAKAKKGAHTAGSKKTKNRNLKTER